MDNFIRKLLFLFFLTVQTQAGILHECAEQGQWEDIRIILATLESEEERREQLNARDMSGRTVLDIVASSMSQHNDLYRELAQIGACHGNHSGFDASFNSFQMLKEIDQAVQEFERSFEPKPTSPSPLAPNYVFNNPPPLAEHGLPIDSSTYPSLSPDRSSYAETTKLKALSEEEVQRHINELIQNKIKNALEISQIDHFELSQIRDISIKKCEAEGAIDYVIPPTEALLSKSPQHPGLRIICFRDSEDNYRVIIVLDCIDRGAEGRIFLGIELKRHSGKSNDSDIYLAIKIIDFPCKFWKKENRRTPFEKFEDERTILKHIDPYSEHLIIESKIDPENGKTLKNGSFYIITRYKGIPLADLPSPLPAAFIYKLCVKILDVVKLTHGLGIIHGDFKLRNFLLDAEENLSLIDFGDACFTHKLLQEPCGTDQFQGPEAELPQDERPSYSKAWDLHPVGILLMQLITGFNPEDEAYRFSLRTHLSRALNNFFSEAELSTKGQIDPIRLAFIRLVKRLCHPDINERPSHFEFRGMVKDLKILIAIQTKAPKISVGNSEDAPKKVNSGFKKSPTIRLAIERVTGFASDLASVISPAKNNSRPQSSQSSPHTPTTPPTPGSPHSPPAPATEAGSGFQRIKNSTSPRSRLKSSSGSISGPSLSPAESPAHKRRKASLPLKSGPSSPELCSRKDKPEPS